ncbi:hypothetical protein [Pseudoxanthomonas kaohsiungensis]|uniref:Uncharacterized protein n=1 Tax=Pseudoxanthomonas kaohsiungensis TaxID=283923 RepID=A0ABW3LV13_9GAMM|nr:hypothetical protein [Pseudoxanthomonas kaohsiungensis]KAF1704296.1 hypothetical protein CSC66_05490 [Pseudoxanthomonas kaohsiungensis]
MNFNPTYFSCLQQAIEHGSLPRLEEAMASIYEDYLKRTGQQRQHIEYNLHSLPDTYSVVVDARGEDDITALMLACLLYQEKVKRGDRAGALAQNTIARWLLEHDASVGAEGCRPMVRAVDRNTGKTVYVRGRGKNLLEAVGWSALPPSVQQHMQPGRFQREARRQDSRLAVAA